MDSRTYALTYDDFCRLAVVVADLEPRITDELARMADPVSGRVAFASIDWEALGLPLIFALLRQTDSNLRAFLAGVAGDSVEEFGQRPIADVMGIVRSVIDGLKAEDWSAFLGLFGAMSANQAPTSTASSTATAGETATLQPLRPDATAKRRSRAA